MRPETFHFRHSPSLSQSVFSQPYSQYLRNMRATLPLPSLIDAVEMFEPANCVHSLSIRNYAAWPRHRSKILKPDHSKINALDFCMPAKFLGPSVV